jgi:hypothetical protein
VHGVSCCGTSTHAVFPTSLLVTLNVTVQFPLAGIVIQGTTTLAAIPGVTIGTITVTSPTTMTVQLTAASNAVAQPYSVLAITGFEQDVLPNGMVLQ